MNQYHFKVEYFAGKNNVVADFLSRYQVATIENEYNINIGEEQRKDPFFNDIYEHLTEGMLPSHDKKYAAKVKRIAECCFLEDDKIYYRLCPKNARQRECLLAPQILRDKILHHAHTTILAGHGGPEKTLQKIYNGYWWPRMSQDVDKFIKQCERCMTAKHKPPKPAPLQALPIPFTMAEVIHFDLLGPLKTSAAGNKYVLAITDTYSRYAVVVAVKSKNTEEIATAIFNNWICHFGVPKECISDRGGEFCSEVMDELCKKLEIRKKMTSPIHPQTNSKVESFNRTIIKYMRTILDDWSTLDWELYLAPLMFAYNTRVHKATMETPFF